MAKRHVVELTEEERAQLQAIGKKGKSWRAGYGVPNTYCSRQRAIQIRKLLRPCR